GWNVIATMRNPENEKELNQLDNVLVAQLDVLDLSSIQNAIQEGIQKFGGIDVLLNNAGYGAYGPLEAFSREKIVRQFNTNVIGLLDVTKAILPHFREHKKGIIINISSIGGKVTFPLGTLYHGTKFAVEGISESLHYEVEQFGGKVKIIEPGMIATDFAGRSFDFTNDENLIEYQNIVGALLNVMPVMSQNASPSSVVADVIFEAATDGKNKLRYTAGEDAKQLLTNRKEYDDETFIGGIYPTPTNDGAYSPSKLALMMATSSKTDYKKINFSNPNKLPNRKILMVCTEERNMKMANGNHPVEMLLPMLHLQNAGFDIDIYTPTGKSVKIEMWAFPKKDEEVKLIFEKYKSFFESPKNLADFVNKEMEASKEYVAVFIPGGHGAMLGLPNNKDVEQLILWSEKNELMMLSICHGPAALLAASISDSSHSFIYRGYKIAAFPDKTDRLTPIFGYMPGHMPWIFGEKLQKLGVEIVNTKADKTCFKDRNLITGASPKAANNF
ncbi:unnamed protein product, partial [Darwinula stevensoni]